jgi:hypothetical protein
MADIAISKFTPKGFSHPKSRIITWSATLTPAPAGEWRTGFRQELAVEGTVGNTGGANLKMEGGVIEFDAPENMAQAAASTIHRVVERTNRKVAALATNRLTAIDTIRKESDEAAQDLKRMQEEYKDGI